MRMMGWSFRQLLECPLHYLEVIAEVAREDEPRR